MESAIDNELIALIRRSEEEAFYAFCRRHWNSLYVRLLNEKGSKEEAFESVKDLFIDLWERRRQLPEKTVSIETYMLAYGRGRQEKNGIGGVIANFIAYTVTRLKKLPGNSPLNERYFRYKRQ